ncbi:MAG: ribosome-associated translation inhibitor RaiA [Actinomycetota bacterium]
MDIVVKGRGVRLTRSLHAVTEEKLAKIPHWEPRATRAEVQFIAEHNPKLDGVKRVEAAVDTPKKRFRAHGQGPGYEAALDQMVERLGRQMREHREKKRRAVIHGANRLKSAQAGDGLSSRRAR